MFDIDGVLADVRHRLHHVEGRSKDWDAFFAAAVDDPPLTVGVELARELAEACTVVYLTGRPERCRADTERWLLRHHLPQGTVWMRRPGDRRPARLVKPELLRRLAQTAAVDVVVDDDPAVCEALERAGWRVLRAEWMERPELLDDVQERQGRT